MEGESRLWREKIGMSEINWRELRERTVYASGKKEETPCRGML